VSESPTGCQSPVVTAAAFNTHSTVRTLIAAGMPEVQAQAIAAVTTRPPDPDLSTLASKSDVAETRTDLLHDIVDTRAELTQTRADLLTAVAQARSDVRKWMIGVATVAVVINAAAVIAAMLLLVRALAR
jgi:hypothetical protein